MNSQTTTVRVEQRTVTTTGGSLPFGLTFQKIALVAILLKIIATVFNISGYAVVYKDRKKYILGEVQVDDLKSRGEKLSDDDRESMSRVVNLSRSSDLLVQLCLCFCIVTFLMIITSFSLKPSFGLRLPNAFCFDIAYHLVAGLLLGGTALAVLALQGHKTIPDYLRTKKFATGGALALVAAIFHLLHFVLSLITWKRVETVR